VWGSRGQERRLRRGRCSWRPGKRRDGHGGRPVGAENWVTSCDLQVFVDEAAEPVASEHADARPGTRRSIGFGWALVQGSVRAVGVEVLHVLAQHDVEVAWSGRAPGTRPRRAGRAQAVATDADSPRPPTVVRRRTARPRSAGPSGRRWSCRGCVRRACVRLRRPRRPSGRCGCGRPAQHPGSERIRGRIWRRPILGGLVDEYEAAA
jgi:hypothetical protein